jgi:putative ABC transport system permease protein
MFRSYVVAALRNLARNRLYAAINIIGLAVGFAAAILIALFVRDELSFDRFWPDYERVYMVSMELRLPGIAGWRMDAAPGNVTSFLRPKLPPATVMARLMPRDHVVRRGHIEANESILWVDPDFFTILPLPVIAGDIDSALRRPNNIVLTERVARKYFGDGNPLGQALELDRGHSLQVAAVVRDVPDNSHFAGDVFASGITAYSELAQYDANAAANLSEGISSDITAYVKLPPGTSSSLLQSSLSQVSNEILEALKSPDHFLNLSAMPIAAVHLSPEASAMKARGRRAMLYSISLIGVLIILVAGINFVVLMSARSGRRAIEIGVRKASGAEFGDLAIQFMGESVIYCLLAMLIALALVELLLPAFNDFMQRDIAFGYSLGSAGDFRLRAMLPVLAVVTGMCAGFYPAVVLSRFRPASVLKGSGSSPQVGGGRVRQLLVICQFAVLITLIVATIVVYRQVQFALNEGTRIDKDQTVVVIGTACAGSFVDEVRRLPGVRDAACSEDFPVHTHSGSSGARSTPAKDIAIFNVAVEPGFLDLYGLRPVAGRFFARNREAGAVARSDGDTFRGPVIINETAARQLGFASPAAAVGQVLRHTPGPHQRRTDVSPIIGVVSDFPIASVHSPVDPVVFHTGVGQFHQASIKLQGRRIPETLGAIDELWKRLGEPKPIQRVFVDKYVQDQYADDIKQGQMFAGFALVALFIACLGLFGLSAFTAERRTKEIGIRKAMGAGRGEMVRMLLLQFTRPVLWANLIAWPVGYYVMNRWLHGFAYRIELSPWMFVLAGGIAVTIAWLTVSVHAFAVARAKPVEALRYE